MICPNCKENRAHRSHRQGLNDYAHKLFQMIPYRCHACKTRFYAYRSGEMSSKLRTAEERKVMQLRRRIKWQRTKKELVAFTVGGAVAAGLIYYMIQQRVG